MAEAPTPKLRILPQAPSGWIWLLAKLVVSVAILAVVVSRADLSQINAAILRMRLGPYQWALVAIAASTTLAACRWSMLTRRMASPIAPGSAIAMYFGASFVGQILPSTLGMDAVRAWAAAKRHKPLSDVLGAIMVDRTFGFMGLALLILIGVPHLLALGDVRIGEMAAGAAIALVAAIAVGAGGVLMLLRAQVSGVWAKAQVLARVLVATAATPTGLLVLPLSIFIHALLTISVLLIAAALDVRLTPLDAFATVPAAMLISTVPISINGWGLREGALIACLALAGVNAADAFAISVMFGVGQFLGGLPGAAFWLFARRAPSR